MIIDKAINTFIDSELIRENKEREALHEPSGKLSASMLYQPTRFQIMKYLNIPRREFDPYTLGKFKRGIDVETWFVDRLDKAGFLIESQKAVEFEATDSASEKALYIYRLLVHDKVISPMPEDQVSEKTIRHRLATWYAHQLPDGHPLLQ